MDRIVRVPRTRGDEPREALFPSTVMSVDGLPVPDGEYLVDGDYILIENGWMWSTPDNDDPNEVWEYVNRPGFTGECLV